MSLKLKMVMFQDLPAMQSLFTYLADGKTERATVLEDIARTLPTPEEPTMYDYVAIKLFHRDKYGDNAVLFFPHEFDKMFDFLDRNCRDADNYPQFMARLLRCAFDSYFPYFHDHICDLE